MHLSKTCIKKLMSVLVYEVPRVFHIGDWYVFIVQIFAFCWRFDISGMCSAVKHLLNKK